MSAEAAQTLGGSARAAVLWGGGFTVFRDIVQFVTMLVLVRLLSPSDYGSAALAQTILGLLAVVSFGTFALHTLQIRDPAEIDWQGHFTAALIINLALALITLGVAWLLSHADRYADAAMPLAALSLVFLVEIPATLRHRMVQVSHNWKRFRLLLIAGSLLGAVTGILIAILGGGVWALIVQPILLGVPAAFDLMFIEKWRPSGSWTWRRYRETAQFGATRVGVGLLLHGRKTVEQSILAGTYDFATLGVFTRSMGLAMLVAGRLGTVVVDALYPVITRAEQGSAQFQRYAELVLRGVVWTTVPAALFLALSAGDITNLIYGARWSAVIPFLPLAAAAVSLSGITLAANGLLLANNQLRACLALDAVSAVLGVALALILVPIGVEIYLAALAGHGLILLGLTISVLTATGGIGRWAVIGIFVPAIVAGAIAAGSVTTLRIGIGLGGDLGLRLLVEVALFFAVYLGVLRVVFEQSLRELLEVAPGGCRIGSVIALAPQKISRQSRQRNPKRC